MSKNQPPDDYCITLEDVKIAASRIQGIAHRTPVLTSASIDRLAGRNLFFKVEALQKTGSFKFRGALNATKEELERRAANNNNNNTQQLQTLQVVTHSSGNHAQALALAAKLATTDAVEVTATIVMPQNTPDVKRNAVADFGATIVLVESTNKARQEKADEIVQETGASFIHPSEDPRVIAGQGTVCLELLEQLKTDFPHPVDLDAVIIPGMFFFVEKMKKIMSFFARGKGKTEFRVRTLTEIFSYAFFLSWGRWFSVRKYHHITQYTG